MEDFLTSGPTLALFDAVFQHVEGYEGLPDLAHEPPPHALATPTTEATRFN